MNKNNNESHSHGHTHGHTHEHIHHNGHHHDHAHIKKLDSLNWIYTFSISLNLLFVIIEAGIGFKANSLGLLSDAGHNLSDVFSLLLAMIAFKLSYSKSTKRFTYGYKKTSILISLFNAFLLLGAVGAIILESIRKFTDPNSLSVNGNAIAVTAGIGILINGLTAILLMKQQKHDINTRGAYLHMVADTLVSIGVLVSGVVIAHTGWMVIDPIISLIIAGVILISTWRLLSESFRMSIDAVPENIDSNKIYEIMEKTPGVKNVHHLHIWPISTTEIALTAHVIINDLNKLDEIRTNLKEKLAHKGISHSTLEIETSDSHCPDKDFVFKH